jgi:dihydrodipicolinate synthase/N-acetylneuraminate lyase
MLTRTNYRGVFAYPPTPFTPGSLLLDEEAVRSNIAKLGRAGVDGIVMAGSSGEFYTLNPTEYRRLGLILQEECARAGILSVLGTSGLSTREVIERTTMAMDLGLDGAIALQPFYNVLTTAELRRFWSDIAAACPDIGLIVYNYEWVRQDYSLETFRELAELPNIVGSKEAHWDFAKWLQAHRGSPLAHMSATDVGWLVEMHKHKAVGVGSMHVCLMPHVMRHVLDACAAGDYPAAEKALAPFTEVVSCLKLGAGRPHVFPSVLADWPGYSGTARHKAMVDAFGFLQAGPPRPPGLAVPEKTVAALRDYLEQRWPFLLPPSGDVALRNDGRRLWSPNPETSKG